ncbi:MAG: hypothetical protein V4685_05070 [Bacteroidota bacterium]
MKTMNFLKAFVLVLFIVFAVPSFSKAADVSRYASVSRDTTGSVEVYSRLVTRLSEIESMDKTNLTSAEKRNLRNELRDMKKAADGLNQGVYLSVGAIIIIILILILILK